MHIAVIIGDDIDITQAKGQFWINRIVDAGAYKTLLPVINIIISPPLVFSVQAEFFVEFESAGISVPAN